MKHTNNHSFAGYKTLPIPSVCLALLMACTTAYAQQQVDQAEPADQVDQTRVRWQATDTVGDVVTVPVKGKTSLVLFVKADQDRSDRQAVD